MLHSVSSLPVAGPSVPRSLLVDPTKVPPTTQHGLSHQLRPEPIQVCLPQFDRPFLPTQILIKSSSAANSIPVPSRSSRLTFNPGKPNQNSSAPVKAHGPPDFRTRPRLLTTIRLADHLLAASGVSFACSLHVFTSPHGTTRLASRIVRNVSRTCVGSRPGKSPKSQNAPAFSNSSPTSSSVVPPVSSQPCDRATPSFDPEVTSSVLLTDMNSAATNLTGRKSPSRKPKSWADLLRIAPQMGPFPSPNFEASSSVVGTPVKKGDLPSKDANEANSATLSEKLDAAIRMRYAPYVVPRGLVNNGNLCFANAILQVLVHCPPFYNLITCLGKAIPQNLVSHTPLLHATIAFVQQFRTLDQLETPTVPPGGSESRLNPLREDESFIAESVWAATKGNPRFDAMRRGHQEDAQEFLCFFLETIHEELMLAIDRCGCSPRPKHQDRGLASTGKTPYLDANEILSGSDWLEVGSKGRPAVTRSVVSSPSPLSRIFDFRTRSVLHRPGQKDSVTFEPSNILQLSIEHSSIETIEDALAHFSSPDIISDMRTQNGQRITATKQVCIDTFPPVLVLHIKRFNFDNGDGSVKKNHKQIRFQTDLKIPPSMRSPGQRHGLNTERDVAYKLFAAVYHHGPSASGGHYTVSLRQQLGERWIYIDDTHIQHVSSAAVVTSAAENVGPARGSPNPLDKTSNPTTLGHSGSRAPYLLFYTRC